MIPTHRVSTHPGIILIKEFLEPLGLSQTALAEHLGISVQRVNEIVRGKRGITPETAWLFAKAFNMSPEFWLSLQSAHDLSSHRPLVEISPLVSASAYPKAYADEKLSTSEVLHDRNYSN